MAAGVLDEDRWQRFEKLKREAARNDASVADRRASSKATGKMHKRVQGEHRRSKRRD
jgi:hypothetical protein